jgi:uncharacterized protein (TIGR02246 family)
MMKTVRCVLGGALVAAVAVGLLAARPTADDEPVAPKRQGDEEAIRAVSAGFIRALQAGDAKALAVIWTDEGEYVGEDGTVIHGRSALESAYAKALAKHHEVKVEGGIDSIRFVSRDSAIVEGSARVQRGKGEPAAARFNFLVVRENGKWLLAVVREWPDDGTSLKDIQWLIGTWEAKTATAQVRATYAWDEDHQFINARFQIKEKGHATSLTEKIGVDPSTSQLRTWLFESDGGIGEANWSRDGKRWLLKATGVQADGSEMTATNILTPVDKDSFTWQAIDRTKDGDDLPSIPPVKVTRVKEKKENDQ